MGAELYMGRVTVFAMNKGSTIKPRCIIEINALEPWHELVAYNLYIT